jgi:hypothetical protein
LVTPSGTCTDGTTIAGAFQMPGLVIEEDVRRAPARRFSIPEKNASLAITPQLFKVFNARSWDGALRAVTIGTRERFCSRGGQV